jgi:Zn-finger nucleic acid-binding protein
MDCPVCKTVSLSMADRQGIEIDYCPQCRGVWLDRGELDKLIERASAAAPAPSMPTMPSNQAPVYPEPHAQPGYRQDRRPGHHPRKREGFWSDLFDFD